MQICWSVHLRFRRRSEAMSKLAMAVGALRRNGSDGCRLSRLVSLCGRLAVSTGAVRLGRDSARRRHCPASRGAGHEVPAGLSCLWNHRRRSGSPAAVHSHRLLARILAVVDSGAAHPASRYPCSCWDTPRSVRPVGDAETYGRDVLVPGFSMYDRNLDALDTIDQFPISESGRAAPMRLPPPTPTRPSNRHFGPWRNLGER